MQACSYCDVPAGYVNADGMPVCFAHYDGSAREGVTYPMPATAPNPDRIDVIRTNVTNMVTQVDEAIRHHTAVTTLEMFDQYVTESLRGEAKSRAEAKRAAEGSNWHAERIRKLEAALYAIGVLANDGDAAVLPAIVVLAHNFEGTAEG